MFCIRGISTIEGAPPPLGLSSSMSPLISQICKVEINADQFSYMISLQILCMHFIKRLLHLLLSRYIMSDLVCPLFIFFHHGIFSRRTIFKWHKRKILENGLEDLKVFGHELKLGTEKRQLEYNMQCYLSDKRIQQISHFNSQLQPKLLQLEKIY